MLPQQATLAQLLLINGGNRLRRWLKKAIYSTKSKPKDLKTEYRFIKKTGGTMKDYIFGNLTDWGSALDKLLLLRETGDLDNHQDELVRLLRFDGNWRLREAAVEASSALTNPSVNTLRQLIELMKRGDLYYNVRIMAVKSLSILVPVIIENKGGNSDLVRAFVDDANHEVTILLSSPEPPIFHDVLDLALDELQRVAKVA